MVIAQEKNVSLAKSALPGRKQFLAIESPLKMMEKCFLIHLKSSLRSQDI